MNHIQVIIEATEEQQDILISELSALGTTGFEQTDTHLIAYFEEDSFESSVASDIVKNFSFQINTVKEQNWNETWEKSFEPVVIDTFCAVRAHFHQPIQKVQHQIIITPKMSFGTGHHATTYLMMEAMSRIDFSGKTVFDFGTGTGILAILAEKLGAAGVSGIDVDNWSIENAQENVERNGCTKISVRLSSNFPQQKFDILLANINRNVLLQYIKEIANAGNQNATILLSGMLEEDGNEVIRACQQYGLVFVKQTIKDNWIALLFVKGKSLQGLI